jgi:hypothetical protein
MEEFSKYLKNKIIMSEFKKSFQKVRYVGWESSMSPTIEREKKTMQYHVWWDKNGEQGGFEVYDVESGGEDYYGEGGLEFTGKVLDGYDGVFSLDDEVVKCVKEWGADTKDME